MTSRAQRSRRQFIRENTRLIAPPHVPEIMLHLADEAHDLWLKTEDELGAMGLEPPFWAFAWAGGQGLARYILDNREIVTGKRVFDFATGSGLVAISAMKAGAAQATASDIDAFCQAALALNSAANNVNITFTDADCINDPLDDYDVLLAGDVFYDSKMAKQVLPWFKELKARGKAILIGDPGRSYLPREQLTELACYKVPVTRALEDAEVKQTIVWSV